MSKKKKNKQTGKGGAHGCILKKAERATNKPIRRRIGAHYTSNYFPFLHIDSSILEPFFLSVSGSTNAMRHLLLLISRVRTPLSERRVALYTRAYAKEIKAVETPAVVRCELWLCRWIFQCTHQLIT